MSEMFERLAGERGRYRRELLHDEAVPVRIQEPLCSTFAFQAGAFLRPRDYCSNRSACSRGAAK